MQVKKRCGFFGFYNPLFIRLLYLAVLVGLLF